jgi:DNA-directed RNA polymerase specialized sigma24 family protein
MILTMARDALKEFLTYRSELFGFIRAVFRNTHDAEDVFQEVACVVLEKPAEAAQVLDFRAWIKEVARRQVLQHFRMLRARKTAGVPTEEMAELAAAVYLKHSPGADELTEEVFTPDYGGLLRDFLRDLEARQLRAVISQGGTGPVDIPDRHGFAQRPSDILDQTGTANVVAIIGGANESWQTGESDPNRLAQLVGWFKQRHPATLYTISSPPGETADELNAWSIRPADLFDVHGYRGGRWWDKVRHIFSISYEGRPQKRLGWQGEPTGPGGAVSVTENKHELDDDTLAAMAEMSLMSRQAWCFMSGAGVLFDYPIDSERGFWTVPRVRDALPRDIMGFSRLFHGGDRLASERIFAPSGETRCDHALSDDGRFVAVIYGPYLTYSQVRPASIEHVTDPGGKARIIVGRRQP